MKRPEDDKHKSIPQAPTQALGLNHIFDLIWTDRALYKNREQLNAKQRLDQLVSNSAIFFKSSWKTIKKPSWILFLSVIVFVIVTKLPAKDAFLISLLIFILLCCMTVEVLLNHKSITGWAGIVLSIAAFALVGIVYILSLLIMKISPMIASATGGDADIMLALLCALSSMSVPLLAMRIWTLVIRKHENSGFHVKMGSSLKRERLQKSEELKLKRMYWVDSAYNLGLICLALIPAALLASWSWNVLASVVLPIFLLSVKNYPSQKAR